MFHVPKERLFIQDGNPVERYFQRQILKLVVNHVEIFMDK